LAAQWRGRWWRGQQPNKIPKIGISWHAGSADEGPFISAALRTGLNDFGYIDNKNIVLENRFPAEKATISSPAARACSVELRCLGGCNGVAQQNAMQQATKTIPTVFVIYQLIYFLKQISFRVWHTRVATLLDLPYEEKLLLI
jgi:hypothetical protein